MSWNCFLPQQEEIAPLLQKLASFYPVHFWCDENSPLLSLPTKKNPLGITFHSFNGLPWAEIHKNPLSFAYVDQNFSLTDPLQTIMEKHPSVLILNLVEPLNTQQNETLQALLSLPIGLIMIAPNAQIRDAVSIPNSLQPFTRFILTGPSLGVDDLAQNAALNLQELESDMALAFLRKVHEKHVAAVATRFDSPEVTYQLLTHELDATRPFLSEKSPTPEKPMIDIAVGTLFYELSPEDQYAFLDSLEAATRQCAGQARVHLYWATHDQRTDYFSGIDHQRFSFTIHSVESPGNPGFGTGMNRLMKSAFENLASAFIGANPDGIWHPNFFKEIINFHASNPTALIEARQFPEEHPKTYNFQTNETDWVSGSCFLMPPEIFRIVGGFDENFFMYCEDVDLSWRVRQNGFPTLLCPSALFMHSPMNASKKAEAQSLLSARYLALKWKNTEFRAWCESRLVEYYGFTPATLPRLPVPKSIEPLAESVSDHRVANFDHQLFFSETRW